MFDPTEVNAGPALVNASNSSSALMLARLAAALITSETLAVLAMSSSASFIGKRKAPRVSDRMSPARATSSMFPLASWLADAKSSVALRTALDSSADLPALAQKSIACATAAAECSVPTPA